MGAIRLHLPLLLCLSAGLVRQSGAVLFWSSVIETNYVDATTNRTVDRICECGVYGRSSPVVRADGVVRLPRGDLKGCGGGGPDGVYGFNSSTPPWIALVKRGNCTFSEKINAAKLSGAAGVVVYNVDGSGNSTTHMAHSDAAGIVAVMIGNMQGVEVAALVRNGTEVRMVVDVGSPHGPWMDTYWLYILSIAFFVVTAASVAYFVFISARRLYWLNRERRQERRLQDEAKKAVRRLPSRTLRRGDEELAAAGEDGGVVCAVCIESYREGEVVTVLTCKHVFHQECIEPWLLQKRTCPMCKCNIMKALGVEDEPKEDVASSSSSPPPTPTSDLPPGVTVVTVAGEGEGDAIYEVPLTELASDAERREDHLYDNRVFHGDAEAARG
ncbi:unnamed protein product [Ophioblennius macclurei]